MKKSPRPGRHILNVYRWASLAVDGERPRHRRAIARLAMLALRARAHVYVWVGV